MLGSKSTTPNPPAISIQLGIPAIASCVKNANGSDAAAVVPLAEPLVLPAVWLGALVEELLGAGLGAGAGVDTGVLTGVDETMGAPVEMLKAGPVSPEKAAAFGVQVITPLVMLKTEPAGQSPGDIGMDP
jgi:hypothetical protein